MGRQQAEVQPGKLKSKIPQLVKERQLTINELVRRGLAVNTAYRAMRGATDFTTTTLEQLLFAFEETSLDALFEYVVGEPDETDQS